jgi:hypothetical protein
MRKMQKKVSSSLGKNREENLFSADGVGSSFLYDTIIRFGGSGKHTLERYCYLFGLSVVCVCVCALLLVVRAAVYKSELVKDRGCIQRNYLEWLLMLGVHRGMCRHGQAVQVSGYRQN